MGNKDTNNTRVLPEYKREGDGNKRYGRKNLPELGESSANPHCTIWERTLLWPILIEKEREYYAFLEYLYHIANLVEDAVFEELVIFSKT